MFFDIVGNKIKKHINFRGNDIFNMFLWNTELTVERSCSGKTRDWGQWEYQMRYNGNYVVIADQA